MSKYRIIVGCLLFGSWAVFSPSARADRASDISAQLRLFDNDPASFMWQRPLKWNRSGIKAAPTRLGKFSNSRVADKGRIRDQIASSSQSPLLGGTSHLMIGATDHPESMVDQLVYRNLEQMASAHLQKATLPSAPWSDTYWPTYDGSVAQRYADPAYPHSEDWQKNSDYLMAHVFDIQANATSIDTLSPAEKYDLLAGDRNWTLTHAALANGKGYYDASGSVETWMGICHGWAAASYMLPRPVHATVVTAADGHTKIDFYPSDIKALASLLWANAPGPTRFVGQRCEIKDPPTDPAGRIIDPGCFDTNPATWHLSVVNQIGASHRSMVIDANYDYEVWNQPIYSYEYTFFNPQTQATATDPAAASVKLSDFTQDKFHAYRSSATVTVVGVAMDVTYMSETEPTHHTLDSETDDSKMSVRYLYDLELNGQGDIIGGEWYQNTHPDFLWTAVKGAQALSMADHDLDVSDPGSTWAGNTSMPASWATAIPSASAHDQPLARVVNALITLSQSGI